MPDVPDLVAEVRASRRYRHVSEEMIRRIGQAELAAAPDRRTAVKAVKRKLHQAVGAFGRRPPYDGLLSALQVAYQAHDSASIAEACAAALRWHASTRERLPILADLYGWVFGITGRPRRVLDLGCGLSPLALPWMRLPAGATYRAFDVDELAVEFVNSFLALAGLPPLAEVRDVVARPPEEDADVAFLLKMIPTLEQQEVGSSQRILEALSVPFIVVSFPARSLGGREKGMVRTYSQQMEVLLSTRRWESQLLTFASELVYVIHKGSASRSQ